jgi:glycerol-3-phosphate acyltransferase PlsY
MAKRSRRRSRAVYLLAARGENIENRVVEWAGYLAASLGAFLMGSVPTGYLVAKARGLDIRSAGSGNIGATNVFRALGKGPGLLVLAVDACKGVAACWWAPILACRWLQWAGAEAAETVALCAGASAILGHNYTPWLRFKGGKGVATTAGALLVLMPEALGTCLVVWLAMFGLTRYVSVASISAALALPLTVWAWKGSRVMVLTALALGALAVFEHRANIRRILAGTEHRFGLKQNHRPTGDKT